jgi:predicted nuclease of restriction endonuclease-like (RecB) superfamily
MRRFTEEYPDIDAIRAQAVRKLPWGHVIVLVQKAEDAEMRESYVTQTLENGWSRSVLEKYISQHLYQSQGLSSNKASNFLERLPLPQKELYVISIPIHRFNTYTG